ncbi:apicoplast pyruvate carrier 1-like [Babylonia areolata]|uniref:apicoplast pyruvate carrier 1-like n=1 Tax=Babylonia areolata TaxID=304850 RepID=UPI003FD00CDE
MCIAGQFYIIGNVGTYMESYLKERGDYPQGATWLIASLVTCVFAGGQVGVMVGGYLDRAHGSHLTTLLGLTLIIVGVALSTWTIRVSTIAVFITFGILPSLGYGAVYGCPLSALNKHNFRNLSLVYGFVNSGFGGGAVLWNFVISAFINPENRAPDKVYSQGRYFSQGDILDRTPFSFLLLTALYAVLLPLSVWGMRPPPPPSSETANDVISRVEPDHATSGAERKRLKGDHCSLSKGTTPPGTYKAFGFQEIPETPEQRAGDGGGIRDDRGGGGGGGDKRGGKERGGGGEDRGGGLSPRQLFRCRTFYVLWIMTFFSGLPTTFVVSHYKELGQTEIRNDMLLVSMGTVGSLLSAVGRPVWGFVVNRYSFQTAAIVQSSLVCIFLAFWRVALLTGEALYYLFTVLLFTWVSALPMFLMISCNLYFGKDHLVANLSLLWTSATAESLLLPILKSLTLPEYGWDGLLLVMSVSALVGLLATLLIPRETTPIDDVRKSGDVKKPDDVTTTDSKCVSAD